MLHCDAAAAGMGQGRAHGLPVVSLCCSSPCMRILDTSCHCEQAMLALSDTGHLLRFVQRDNLIDLKVRSGLLSNVLPSSNGPS